MTEGQKALTTLASFDDEAGGACATALTDLEGYVKLYIASVNSLGTAVDQGNNASAQAAIDNSSEALARSRETFAPFEAACKPTQ